MTALSSRFLGGAVLMLAHACLLAPANAQDPLSPLRARSFADVSGLNLPYRLFVPESYDPSQKYPLVLFLHGGGDRGTDNRSPLLNETFALDFVSARVQAAHPSFLLVPQAPQLVSGGDPRGEYWVNNYQDNLNGTPHAGWTPDTYKIADYPVSTSLSAVGNLIPSLLSEFAIDSNRLYATGWSMGGDATWDLLMRNPGLFAAGAPIAGVGDPTQATVLAHTPIWVFQGAQDQAASPSGSQKMVSAIRAQGGNIHYTEFADGTHYIGERAYREPGFMDWLFSQSLPATIPVPTPVPIPVQHMPEPGAIGLVVLGLLGSRLVRRR